MTVSLLSTFIARAIGLPIFALGERVRERRGADRRTSPARKETTP